MWLRLQAYSSTCIYSIHLVPPLQIFIFPVAVGELFPLSQSATLVDGLDKQDTFLLLSLATAHDKQDKFWPVQEAASNWSY
jgi:hypothetical protein